VTVERSGEVAQSETPLGATEDAPDMSRPRPPEPAISALNR